MELVEKVCFLNDGYIYPYLFEIWKKISMFNKIIFI